MSSWMWYGHKSFPWKVGERRQTFLENHGFCLEFRPDIRVAAATHQVLDDLSWALRFTALHLQLGNGADPMVVGFFGSSMGRHITYFPGPMVEARPLWYHDCHESFDGGSTGFLDMHSYYLNLKRTVLQSDFSILDLLMKYSISYGPIDISWHIPVESLFRSYHIYKTSNCFKLPNESKSLGQPCALCTSNMAKGDTPILRQLFGVSIINPSTWSSPFPAIPRATWMLLLGNPPLWKHELFGGELINPYRGHLVTMVRHSFCRKYAECSAGWHYWHDLASPCSFHSYP